MSPRFFRGNCPCSLVSVKPGISRGIAACLRRFTRGPSSPAIFEAAVNTGVSLTTSLLENVPGLAMKYHYLRRHSTPEQRMPREDGLSACVVTADGDDGAEDHNDDALRKAKDTVV